MFGWCEALGSEDGSCLTGINGFGFLKPTDGGGGPKILLRRMPEHLKPTMYPLPLSRKVAFPFFYMF